MILWMQYIVNENHDRYVDIYGISETYFRIFNEHKYFKKPNSSRKRVYR